MKIERTLSIIKPDATERDLTGAINKMIEDAGFRIVAQKKIHLSSKQAEQFYEVHKDRSFFRELVDSMIASPVVVQVLESEDAVSKYRNLMGSTNPVESADGTIRKSFALDIGRNSVHGSDSLDNAKNEINFFFSATEIVG